MSSASRMHMLSDFIYQHDTQTIFLKDVTRDEFILAQRYSAWTNVGLANQRFRNVRIYTSHILTN